MQQTSPSPAVASSVGTAQAIPFRTESPVSTGKVASVLVITVVLLAALLGALLLARRQGWLQRWLGSAGRAGTRARTGNLQVIASTRLSPSTHAYTVEADGVRWVVFESARHIAVQPAPGKTDSKDVARVP